MRGRCESCFQESAVPLSITALAANYQQIADAILNAGPLVNDNLADLKVICEAAVSIRDRTVKHFGLSSGETLNDDELKQLLEHDGVKSANDKLSAAAGVGDGNKGPFVDMLMQLIQLAMQNPALLQMILALFKKPATT